MPRAVAREVLLPLLSVCLLLQASRAAGQTVGATTGAINGKVTDSTGAVLPVYTARHVTLTYGECRLHLDDQLRTGPGQIELTVERHTLTFLV